MRPCGIVVAAPGLDQDLCLAQIEEDFPRQQLIAQLAVEAFAVAVLPRAAWCDVERLDADPFEPVSQGCRDKLGTLSDRMCSGAP